MVLPKKARAQLRLHPGTRFECKVEGDCLILIPEQRARERPQLIHDPQSGLLITQSPPETKVTNEDVRGAMHDFP